MGHPLKPSSTVTCQEETPAKAGAEGKAAQLLWPQPLSCYLETPRPPAAGGRGLTVTCRWGMGVREPSKALEVLAKRTK